MNSLVIFVKAPVAGKVKTRLQVPLNAAQVARMYEAFVRDTVSGARLCGEAAVSIAYEPHPNRPDLSWLKDAPSWFEQAEGDLGARLIAAFDRAFDAGAARAVVIGSDCPDLEPEIIRQAFTLLDDTPAVLGPAMDGGYYLIGLREPMPHLFTMMEWSGPEVLKRTMERLRLRGDDFKLLPERADVDTFGDLKALAARLAAGESRAPHTRAAIDELIVEGLLRIPIGDGLIPKTIGRTE
jgi:rSAM/selenodomain-associated transferase 1